MKLNNTPYQSKRIPLESEIQRKIIDYFKLRNIYCCRVNVGGLRRKGVWTKSGATNGVADLFATIKGITWWIEVKRLGEKQNPDQIEFEKNIKANGGKYVLSYSLNDVRAALGA